MSSALKNIGFPKKELAWSKLILWLLLIIMTCCFVGLKKWAYAETEKKLISWDVTSYYCYLPAAFIHNDVSLEFTKRGDDKSYETNQQFWYQTAPNGSRVIKFGMGMSFLYAPFFFIAHAYAHLFGYEPNGFSTPYEFSIALSSLFYLFLGLLFLRKTLLLFYSELITALTLICVLLGTNLFYYSTLEPAMSHAYSFAVISAFVYYTIQWHSNPSLKKALFIGALFGLIVIIRPINIIVFLFPLLYNVVSWKSFLEKINFLLQNKKHILLMSFIALIVVSPQLIYWKYLTGDWFFYTYQNEHFYFKTPHILKGLLSFRNGWLVYSPIMIFSLLGIAFLYKSNKKFFFPILLFFLLNIFICYSWWTWWYGGSFGSRPMIDSYALLAIPFALFFDSIYARSKIIFNSLICFLLFFIYLNLFQTYQRSIGLIHFDSMTSAAYWKIFLKSDLSADDMTEYTKLLKNPDYEKSMKGIDE